MINRELIEEILKDISTPTGLSYSGDQTIANSTVDNILEFIDDLQKKAELGEHYKHLYSEVKKQKDELEKENNELQKAYELIDKSMYELMKQKDDVVSEIKRVLDIWENKPNEIATLDLEKILRMLGEKDDN